MGRCNEEGCSGVESVVDMGCIGEGVYWRGGVVEV